MTLFEQRKEWFGIQVENSGTPLSCHEFVLFKSWRRIFANLLRGAERGMNGKQSHPHLLRYIIANRA